jgi:hypothetical protein
MMFVASKNRCWAGCRTLCPEATEGFWSSKQTAIAVNDDIAAIGYQVVAGSVDMLTNAFSKKVVNHAAAIALYFT